MPDQDPWNVQGFWLCLANLSSDRASGHSYEPVAVPRQGEKKMPEVIFTGPAGRIEGRYNQSKTRGAPIAIILHPHPQFGGTMNNPLVYALYYSFLERGFSTLRFNFRGVGRSQGAFDHGSGELSDAAC